jgi:hypothetical protein
MATAAAQRLDALIEQHVRFGVPDRHQVWRGLDGEQPGVAAQ